MPSYDRRTISDSPAAEVSRIAAQVALFWEREREVLELIGLTNGMNILEVGCGLGFYTEKLLDRYPTSALVATDIDEGALERARARPAIASGLDRLVLRHQAVEQIEDSAAFDFAVARLVIEHLPQPSEALDRIRNSLVPGGHFACISNDFGWHSIHSPEIEALPKLYAAYRRARKDQGGHPTIGRELPSLLAHAGFTDIVVRAVVAHSDVVGLDMFRAGEGIGIPMRLVADGYLDAVEFASILEAARNVRRSVRVLLVASGRRPHE